MDRAVGMAASTTLRVAEVGMGCSEVAGEVGCLVVGDAEIVLLGDGGALHAPWMDRYSAEYARWLPYLRRHPWAFAGVRVRPARFRSYLVRTPRLTLVVDAGVGPAFSDGGRKTARAAVAGPDEVDVVFLTHSHPLEAGWAFTAAGEPAFPAARYAAQRAEWEAAAPKPYSFLRRLDEMEMLDLLDGEEELEGGIAAIPTPGHSPGHQSLLLSSGGEEALVVGDAFAHPTQVMDPLWSSAQDGDGARAAWTRTGLLDWLEAEGIAVIAGHFPAPGYGRIARGRDGRRRWRALETARIAGGCCAAV